MGPYLKNIFRKSQIPEPTLVFLFSFIEISRNKPLFVVVEIESI